METIEALIHRRSCRKYSDRPVEAEKLARIIEAGQYAPSGMGRQPVTFVAVTDPAAFDKLSAALAGQADAPKLLKGAEGLRALACMDGAGTVLNAAVGLAGLDASLAAIESGHD